MKRFLFGFIGLILICAQISCVDQIKSSDDWQVEGLRPIYASGTDWQNITIREQQPIQQLGKIYYKAGFIFVNEVNQGIHILDNTNPSNPVSVKFIAVPGSKDIAIKGDFLYTDNVTDLVVLDISDLDNITTINRISNIYPASDQNFPEFGQGYFECVDANQGTIIGWETAILTAPQCRI